MNYRIEHNYLLREPDELVAFATRDGSSLRLFILNGDPVRVIKSDDAEAKEDCENLVRPTEVGDITRSEWDDFYDNSNGGTNLLEIDRTYI